MSLNCVICGSVIVYRSKQSRNTCSNACRQLAYRNLKKSKGFRVLHGRFIALDLSNGFDQQKVSSVGSVSNTHTKVWYPIQNDQLKGSSGVL